MCACIRNVCIQGVPEFTRTADFENVVESSRKPVIINTVTTNNKAPDFIVVLIKNRMQIKICHPPKTLF